MRRSYFFIIIASVIFISVPLHALVVGSNTTPSRPALTTFPAADGDNEMRGFAAFENGFTLQNSSTSCLYNSFFPISGTITFNGGTLELDRDLVLTNTVSFADGGIIDGNSYALEFPDKIGTFSLSGTTTFDSIELFLHSDLSLNGLTVFDGSCIINGHGHMIDFSGGTMALAAGANLTIKDTRLDNISAGDISCADTAGVLSLQDVIWIQDADYTFSQGALTIYNTVKMTGGYIFAYSSNQTSTIQSNATWLFDSGMTFSYCPTSASNLIEMTDSTSKLHLYETTLFATAVGLDLLKGTLVVEGECPIESDATIQAEGIRLGDGVSESNDINLKIFPESGFTINSGFFDHKLMS